MILYNSVLSFLFCNKIKSEYNINIVKDSQSQKVIFDE